MNNISNGINNDRLSNRQQDIIRSNLITGDNIEFDFFLRQTSY